MKVGFITLTPLSGESLDGTIVINANHIVSAKRIGPTDDVNSESTIVELVTGVTLQVQELPLEISNLGNGFNKGGFPRTKFV